MRLLAPLPLRRRTAPSRVVFGPIETNLGDHRTFSPRHVAFYERRARGGAGIVVTEIASVHESDWPYERAPLASECVPGWQAIGDAVRATGSGTLVLAGLGHAGGQGTSHWSQREMWAPSPVPEVASREVPKVMEPRDIDDVVQGFADAARRALDAGLDGVEINAGQFSLVRQFLSGLTNLRGGDDADRLRFARDVVGAVRAALGPDPVLALRLSCDEMAPWAGVTPEMAAPIAVELCGLGVDLLTVVRGSIFTAWATQPDLHVEPGFNLGLCRAIRTAVRDAGLDTAVVAQGSIVDAGQAEWALDDGVADAVEMTRAQLADAALVTKLRAEQSARIRPCILCNQMCKVRDNRNPIITCVVDPATGHETEDHPEPSGGRPVAAAPVTVVGAGVAGMEAARILAAAGRPVQIVERSHATGGILPTVALAAGRERLVRIADWLRHECELAGVRIELGREVAAGDLAATDGPVIVASGGRHGMLPFDVDDGARVIPALDALADLGGLPEGPVVVWDPIGGPIAISIAETLAARGRSVTLVTPDQLVGEKLALTGDLAPAQGRLHGLGVTMRKRSLLRHVHPSGVDLEDRFSGERTTIDAAVVVACGHRLPDVALDADEHHPQAGDRVAPRTIHEAILEGRRAAFAVLGVSTR